ncbi:Ent-copalyl diphosphate synthase [Bertholletia excelsa]
MSSSSQTITLLCLLPSSTASSGHRSLLYQATPPSTPFLGLRSSGDERSNFRISLKCKAISKPRVEEYAEVLQDGLPSTKWNGIVEDDIQRKDLEAVPSSNKIQELVNSIRAILGSMDDGEISVSAYDTAWVALVEDVRGGGGPQFPSSLQWIADNQLSDGSWGDSSIFEAHDRIINTLACVIALRSWNIHLGKCQKGLSFIRENINKLGDENAEHMPIGFEVAFPSLIEIARDLDIDIPYHSPVLQEIYAKRNLKLTRIPEDIMHRVPTTLLHSLEGMPGLAWEKLLKLQSPDGSFLFSPSSTAFALMQTKDDNCLGYLSKAVDKFNGGVPNVYPVDLFEHIWAVDRLERLGISRYFRSEIKECIDYVYRYWTEEGICWARNSPVHDIDDTAMGFRLLRLHGHRVSADVFGHFKKGGEFFCFAGQSTQAVTGIYNLYRASQVMFPGEKIMEDAKKFSLAFLREKQGNNELLDKWIIAKDLPGEVGYALEVPWYASLPRVETRFYLEQYGGDDDVWIGKTLYRMPYVNNNIYLELAKMDYGNCQTSHLLEWDSIQKWHTECKIEELGISRTNLLLAYFLAVASIFEPERSLERLAWAKTAVLVEAIFSFLHREGTAYVEERRAFPREFRNGGSNGRYGKTTQAAEHGVGILGPLGRTLNQLSLDALVAHGRDIRHQLRQAWEMWMMTWEEAGEGYGKGEAELLVRTINLCAGRWEPEQLIIWSTFPQYKRLSDITNSVCHHIRCLRQQQQPTNKIDDKDKAKWMVQIESEMQKLVELVLCSSSDGIDPEVKQTFLTVAKAYYYTVHCSPGTVRFHIAKVLFDRVL